MFKDRRGQMQQFNGLVIGIAILAVLLTVVFLILANVAANPQVAADGNASLAIDTLTEAVAEIPNWVSIIVVISIGVGLLAMVLLFARFRSQ